MAAQVSADESLWEVIEEKAQNGTMTAVEHLLYTTLRSTQAKLAESEKQNEDLWLELEKFLRVPEQKEADEPEPPTESPAAMAGSDDDEPVAEFVPPSPEEQRAVERARAAAEAERRARAEAEAEEAANEEMMRYLQKDVAAPRGGLDIHNILA